MHFLNNCVVIFCTIVLVSSVNVCYSASLPSNANNTVDTTAIAKTTTPIMDVFEDIKWFFGRLGIFCELVEKMLPPERGGVDQTQLSFNLKNGFRHFLLGVQEISKSIVAVLSNKEVQEYQQLSRATDYAHEMVKSVGDFFRDIRMLVGRAFETYNYYVPEVLLTKCIGSYLHETYSHRPMYEYPVLLINDIIETFQTPPMKMQIESNTTLRIDRPGNEVNFVKNVEQNEILDDEMYVFHNTAVSPTPELAVRFDSESGVSANGSDQNQSVAMEKSEVNIPEIATWMKCFKIYATETIFRKLEFYFLERKE